MTQVLELTSGSRRAREARIIGLVSAAHFASHFFMLLLPVLLPFVRADYGVSSTELGLAITVFNTVSAGLQTPMGFLADRIGPHRVLIAGLALSATAFALVGLMPSYWALVGGYALAGLGN